MTMDVCSANPPDDESETAGAHRDGAGSFQPHPSPCCHHAGHAACKSSQGKSQPGAVFWSSYNCMHQVTDLLTEHFLKPAVFFY